MISPSLQNTPRPIWRVGDRCQHPQGPGVILNIERTSPGDRFYGEPTREIDKADRFGVFDIRLDSGRDVWCLAIQIREALPSSEEDRLIERWKGNTAKDFGA